MQNKTILENLFSLLKISVFISLVVTITSNAYAEYYMVYPAPSYLVEPCKKCDETCVHYLHSKSPHRHNQTSAGQMATFGWVDIF